MDASVDPTAPVIHATASEMNLTELEKEGFVWFDR